jgi:hypothetical protein
MLKHNAANHKPEVAQYQQCKVQSLYGGLEKKYYGVSEENAIGPSASADAIDQAIVKFDESNENIAPADERLLSSFDRALRWHEKIKTHCSSCLPEVADAAKFNYSTLFTRAVYPTVCRYWQLSQALIGSGEYLLEQILSSEGAEIASKSKFNRIQESGERYCQAITTVLSMVFFELENTSLISGVVYHKDLPHRIGDLYNVTSQASRGIAAYRYKDLVHTACTVEELSSLQAVLEAVYFVCLNDEHSPNEFLEFPTIRFLICNSIRSTTTDSNGYVQFQTPGNITSVVAELKYWARITALMNLHQRSWGAPSSPSNVCSATRANVLRGFLRDGERSPYGGLQEVMRLGQVSPWLPNNGVCLSYAGFQTSLIPC